MRLMGPSHFFTGTGLVDPLDEEVVYEEEPQAFQRAKVYKRERVSGEFTAADAARARAAGQTQSGQTKKKSLISIEVGFFGLFMAGCFALLLWAVREPNPEKVRANPGLAWGAG